MMGGVLLVCREVGRVMGGVCYWCVERWGGWCVLLVCREVGWVMGVCVLLVCREVERVMGVCVIGV